MGGVLIISSFFILLTLLYPQATGIIGSWLVHGALWYTLGKVMYLTPLVLSVAGVMLLARRHIQHLGVRMFGLIFATLNLATLMEIVLTEGPVVFTWPLLEVQGGFLGNVYALLLQKVFGAIGAYFIILISLWIAGLCIAEMTLKAFIYAVRDLFIAEPKDSLPKQQVKPLPAGPRRQVPVAKPQLSQKQRQASMFSMLKDSLGFTEVAPVVATPPEPAFTQRVPSPEPIAPPLRRTRTMVREVEPEVEAYQPRATGYKLPDMRYLKPPVKFKENQQQKAQQFEHDKQVLEATLASFNVDAKVSHVAYGPSVTRYELMPSAGVRVNKISNLADDLSLAMASTVRIEAPVPGKSVVGIEVPNEVVRPVNLSELVEQPQFWKHPLTVALGIDISGHPVYCNIHEMPHLLIAGSTGSGKSVCLNALIMSILLKATPEDVKFLMVDPKRVELSNYNDLPHLVTPVVHEPGLAQLSLKLWAIKEMEKRYEIFSRAGVRNLETYNKLVEKHQGRTIQINQEVDGIMQKVPYQMEHLPYVVIIIDELADLMMVGSRDVEGSICRIAQMARATGMHLIIATQRPSVDVITGLIKANVPSRVAFAVGSQIDSRTIIDGMGAEKLLGKGDMLYSPIGARHLTRVQGVYVSDEEIQKVTSYIKRQASPRYELDLSRLKHQAVAMEQKEQLQGNSPNQRDDGRDVLFDQAAQLVQDTGKKSISYIQRKFRIGYNRAARIMEELQEAGVVNTLQE